MYAVFNSSFSTYLSDFVDVVIVWIAPWAAIFVVDWLLRRRRYVPSELQKTTRDSLYWHSGGVFWPPSSPSSSGCTPPSPPCRRRSRCPTGSTS